MAIRIVIALILSLLSAPLASPLTSPPAGATGSETTVVEPAAIATSPELAVTEIRVVGIDNDPVRSAEAQAVIDRFAEVGLELPPVTIQFHESTTACFGYDGLIRYVEPVPVIEICSDRPYVLPHELAHAWVDANLADAAKAAYVESWGLASWDGDEDWNDRGTEHAAFVIQQNLTASPATMSRTWRERAEAFEMLTGLASPLTPG